MNVSKQEETEDGKALASIKKQVQEKAITAWNNKQDEGNWQTYKTYGHKSIDCSD